MSPKSSGSKAAFIISKITGVYSQSQDFEGTGNLVQPFAFVALAEEVDFSSGAGNGTGVK